MVRWLSMLILMATTSGCAPVVEVLELMDYMSMDEMEDCEIEGEILVVEDPPSLWVHRASHIRCQPDTFDGLGDAVKFLEEEGIAVLAAEIHDRADAPAGCGYATGYYVVLIYEEDLAAAELRGWIELDPEST